MKRIKSIIVIILSTISLLVGCSNEKNCKPINFISANEDLYRFSLNPICLNEELSFFMDITDSIKLLCDDQGNCLCICNRELNTLTFFFDNYAEVYDSLDIQIAFGKLNSSIFQRIKKLQYCYIDHKTSQLIETGIGIFSIKLKRDNEFLHKGGELYLCNNLIFSLKKYINSIKEDTDIYTFDVLEESINRNDIGSVYRDLNKLMIENYDKLLINDILISFFTLDRDAYSDNTVNLNANNEQNMKNKYKIDLNNDVQMIVDYDCFSILFSKEKKILLLSKIYRDNYYTIKDNWACLSLELDDDTFEKYKKIGASVYIKTDSCLEGIKY